MLENLYLAIDWPCLFGFCCLLCVLYWLKRVEYPKQTIPGPDRSVMPQRDLWISSGGRS